MTSRTGLRSFDSSGHVTLVRILNMSTRWHINKLRSWSYS